MKTPPYYYAPAIGRYIPPPTRRVDAHRKPVSAEETDVSRYADPGIGLLEELDREFNSDRVLAPHEMMV